MKKIPQTYEECDEDEKFIVDKLREFKNISAFIDHNSCLYRGIIRNARYLLYIAFNCKRRVVWTLDLLKEDALKYKTRSEWANNSESAYSRSLKTKTIDVCCRHMTPPSSTIREKWTIEKTKEIALMYKTRAEWKEGHCRSYDAACSRKWLDICCSHMNIPITAGLKLTKEQIKEDALKYNSIRDWEISSPKVFSAARRLGVKSECCSHMDRLHKVWTTDLIKEDALKYNSKTEWTKYSRNAYSRALSGGILEECTSHMSKKHNPEENKVLIIEFIVKNNKKPSQHSKNNEEKRLYIAMGNYIRKYSSSFDSNFKEKIETLVKETK